VAGRVAARGCDEASRSGPKEPRPSRDAVSRRARSARGTPTQLFRGLLPSREADLQQPDVGHMRPETAESASGTSGCEHGLSRAFSRPRPAVHRSVAHTRNRLCNGYALAGSARPKVCILRIFLMLFATNLLANRRRWRNNPQVTAAPSTGGRNGVVACGKKPHPTITRGAGPSHRPITRRPRRRRKRGRWCVTAESTGAVRAEPSFHPSG
jgi:hypothetical protein